MLISPPDINTSAYVYTVNLISLHPATLLVVQICVFMGPRLQWEWDTAGSLLFYEIGRHTQRNKRTNEQI